MCAKPQRHVMIAVAHLQRAETCRESLLKKDHFFVISETCSLFCVYLLVWTIGRYESALPNLAEVPVACMISTFSLSTVGVLLKVFDHRLVRHCPVHCLPEGPPALSYSQVPAAFSFRSLPSATSWLSH